MEENIKQLTANNEDDEIKALRKKFDFVLQKYLRKVAVFKSKKKVLEQEFEQKGSKAKMAKVKSFIQKTE